MDTVQLFGVAELAQAANRLEDQDLLIRRIRHWTLAGALVPAGSTHEGTGRHRRYPIEAVYDVAVLNKLADFSLPIGVLKDVAEAIPRLRTERLWDDAISSKNRRPVFLTVIHTLAPDRRTGGFLGMQLQTEEEMLWLTKVATCSVVVNLTATFEEITI